MTQSLPGFPHVNFQCVHRDTPYLTNIFKVNTSYSNSVINRVANESYFLLVYAFEK